MINYTLLPEKETKSLTREYRTRLFVVLLFFVSCGIAVGILSLVPAYILSYFQEQRALEDVKTMEKGRQDRGTDAVISALASTTDITNRLKAHEDKIVFGDVLARVLLHKPPQVKLTSFQVTKIPVEGALPTSVEVVLQGKAATRDALVTFKKELESDVGISGVDLPLSDLAKSKDILFAVKFNLQQ